MNQLETIYLYRRKGQDTFASCDLDRYSELYGHVLFETKIARSSDDYDQLAAENKRLKGEVARLKTALDNADKLITSMCVCAALSTTANGEVSE